MIILSSNSRELLNSLKIYADSLEKHFYQLTSDYDRLKGMWISFSSSAEGDYADQFRAGWQKTDQNFSAYINQSQQIKILLQERINSLAQLNQQEGEIFGGDSQSLSSVDVITEVKKLFELRNDTSLTEEEQEAIDAPQYIEERGNNGINQCQWNFTPEDIQKIEKTYKIIAGTQEEKDLSCYLGEEYGHKTLLEKLGYLTEHPTYGHLLEPTDKYESFRQGFDGIYFDPNTEELVVAEFKGRKSSVKGEQGLPSYVNKVCQGIFSRRYPYNNIGQHEYHLAQVLRDNLEEGNVRYEVYRTCFNSKDLYTKREKCMIPDPYQAILGLVKSISKQHGRGVLSSINSEHLENMKSEIRDLLAIKQNPDLMDYERQEAGDELKQKLIELAKTIRRDFSEQLSRSQKYRLTRAINQYKLDN